MTFSRPQTNKITKQNRSVFFSIRFSYSYNWFLYLACKHCQRHRFGLFVYNKCVITTTEKCRARIGMAFVWQMSNDQWFDFEKKSPNCTHVWAQWKIASHLSIHVEQSHSEVEDTNQVAHTFALTGPSTFFFSLVWISMPLWCSRIAQRWQRQQQQSPINQLPT